MRASEVAGEDGGEGEREKGNSGRDKEEGLRPNSLDSGMGKEEEKVVRDGEVQASRR